MKNIHWNLFSLCLILAACSSSGGPKDLDHTLNSKSEDSQEKVGLRDDKVMIQKRVYLEEQLWSLKSEVDDLQRTLYGASKQDPSGVWLGLSDCRKRVADPRIGGTGKPEAMESWTNITKKDEAFFYKVDKKTNSLVGVSEEALDERLGRYQAHKRVLEQKYDELKGKLDSCEDKYQSTLVQNGLNPNDTKAQGEWVDGPKGYKVWKMKKGPTKDPEELMKRKAKTEQESE
jgi:chaperonin cofactor prefoldin